MSSLAEIQAQIAELMDANENLHDSLDFAESMSDEDAIEFYGSLDQIAELEG